MKKTKARIAVAATVVALAGLAGLALSAGSQAPKQSAIEPKVRTEVVRRTIHVTKYAKPKQPVAAAPPAAAAPAAPAPAATAASGGAEEPVTTATSGTGAEPVTTATSGSGGGAVEEHDVEYEPEGGGEAGDE